MSLEKPKIRIFSNGLMSLSTGDDWIDSKKYKIANNFVAKNNVKAIGDIRIKNARQMFEECGEIK